ncbi:DUF502 domain-containing protein [Thiomonas sp.]|uniref:DUF502 domain-containing protein n=1 Tax=Thiomonas sp. TaxID=2047785 RepID=UPI002A3612FF|nr:DUF502 domain-containing protein [Thiomonas sp.]
MTVAPLWVTWLVFDFVFGLLAKAGSPLVNLLDALLRPVFGGALNQQLHPALHYVLATLLTLAVLYAAGWMASIVIGRRIISAFESLLARLPVVQTIYGATKRFIQSMQTAPMQGQRVVLIAFPSSEMKAVGLVTRIIEEQGSGRQLAAVYVPTAPNPTSGYIEIVPVEDLVATDWTMEEAMTFVMTGGATSPDQVRFAKPPQSSASD